MTLKLKLFLFSVALAYLPLLFGALFFVRSIRGVSEQDARHHLEWVATVQENRIGETIDRYVEWAKLLASRTQLRRNLGTAWTSRDPVLVEQMSTILLDAQASLPLLERISVLDRTGIVAASTDPSHIGRNYAGESHFEQARTTFLLTDISEGAPAKAAVRIAGPLYLDDVFIGEIELIASPEQILKIVGDYAGLGKTGETILARPIDKESAEPLRPLRFESPDTPSIFTGALGALLATTPSADDMAATAQLITDYRGKKVFAVSRFVEPMGWGLVAKIDVDEVRTEEANFQDSALIALLIFITCMSVAVFLFFQSVAQPIYHTTVIAERVRQGDLSQRIPVTSHDELGMLAETFNSMMSQLQDTYAGLEQKVKERTAELEAFTYSVSHDLRAPLRSIDGFSQALLEDYESKLDSGAKDYLHRVRASSQRMAQLIDDMLNLSRYTRKPLEKSIVNLTALSREIAGELQRNQPQRKAVISVSEDLSVYADPVLMRVIMQNLLDNAWKFTSKMDQAHIEVGATEKDGKKVYFVRDNGAGFDPAYMDKLFTPFQRLHSTDEFPGTGIGLATIQRILFRHEGKAWAEGAVDKGATFYFTLEAPPKGNIPTTPA
jgi:signal transduction histidine kinase